MIRVERTTNVVNAVILTKSSKFKNLCVAGINIDTGKWVRFVSDDEKSHGALSLQNIRYADGSIVNILDKVQVHALRPKPTSIQPENVLIDTSKPFIKKGTLTLPEVLEIHPPETHSTILGNDSHSISYQDIDGINHSLIIIKVTHATFNWHTYVYGNQEKQKLKLSFLYNGKYYSHIAVTDPDYYKVRDDHTIKNAILILSLPDDDWSKENGYYKFVAKIFALN